VGRQEHAHQILRERNMRMRGDRRWGKMGSDKSRDRQRSSCGELVYY